MQHVWPDAHGFQGAGAKVLDQHVAVRQQVFQDVHAAGAAQIHRQGFFVAGVDFPVQGMAFDAPGAQRVAFVWVLQLDHFRALIGELERNHVAGDEARQVNDLDAVQRCFRIGFKINARDHARAFRFLIVRSVNVR